MFLAVSRVFRGIMGCSRGVPGLFQAVPGCSGCVPGFTDTHHECSVQIFIHRLKRLSRFVQQNNRKANQSELLKTLSKLFFLLTRVFFTVTASIKRFFLLVRLFVSVFQKEIHEFQF